MDSDRIAALLQPFLGDAVLSPQQLADISIYIDLLLRWNARINLTAVRQPDEIVTRHFGESFFAARHLFPHPDRVADQQAPHSLADRGPQDARVWRLGVADLGSGAGFPGIPIKLWAPTLHVTLIESNQKKVAFLREALRALKLTSNKSTAIDVFPARAEALVNEDLGRQFDVVTLRAVERFPDILPVAAALTAPAGHLALLIMEDQATAVPAQLPAFTWDTPLRVPASARRVLLVGRRGI
jgi:16S rRNA (guanine527-N7)-methyltransferase